jgi:hypothetical protein
MARWKLLGGIALTILLFVVLPYALQRVGLIGAVSSRAGWVLLLAASGLVFKILCGDAATGKFEYHKHGYDFCIITMGAAISSLGLQLTSANDIFHGLPDNGIFALIAQMSPDNVVLQRMALLLVVFLLSSVFALLTGGNSRVISDGKTTVPNLLALLNFVLGVGIFGFYIFLLVAKAQE